MHNVICNKSGKILASFEYDWAAVRHYWVVQGWARVEVTQ